MKKFIALLTEERQLRMNGEMMSLTFFKLYTEYIKIRTIFFSYLLLNLFKERYISSVKSYKYLNKLYAKCKNKDLNFLKKYLYMSTIRLTKL